VVVLADFTDPSLAEVIALGSIGFLPPEVDDDIGASIRRARVFAGYAGWGSGQLEAELDEDSWIVERALPEDVFHPDPTHLWDEVLRRKGSAFDLLRLMPVDPSMN
jgi:putative transcriptional regulator